MKRKFRIECVDYTTNPTLLGITLAATDKDKSTLVKGDVLFKEFQKVTIRFPIDKFSVKDIPKQLQKHFTENKKLGKKVGKITKKILGKEYEIEVS